ncbi:MULTISPECIES: hypothetical protein [Anaerolinea]|uniref:hypothetical protein n=1 Tax=Anaerolinea TaxID=233189 RepID=UPI002635BE50|nr:hypothetical protein [Anaerolinea thermophila]
MKKLRILISFLALLALLAFPAAGRVQAQALQPHTPDLPPQTPQEVSPGEPALQTAVLTALNLPPLKAVLIVGPIDGDSGTWTRQEIANMELAAQELEKHGVTVYRFYTPSNNWEQIKSAASGAHFLFYRGHGIYWSDMPYPTVGGFALKDRFYSSADIQRDLKLAKNAIVMMYACFSAGSASNDTIPVTQAEARRRVGEYSQPFFALGAGGYFANWFGDAFQQYVRFLFEGKTLGQAYQSFYDYEASKTVQTTHPTFPSIPMWLGYDEWYNPKPQWNNAFVGDPAQTLESLFAPAMQVSSPTVAAMLEPVSAPQTFSVQITASNGVSFNWSAAAVGSKPAWLNFTASGSSSQPMQITLQPTGAAGTYDAQIQVNPVGMSLLNAPQIITVRLIQTVQINRVMIPLILR